MEAKLGIKVESGNRVLHTIVHPSPTKEEHRNELIGMENAVNIQNTNQNTRDSNDSLRKSAREKKTPLHLVNSIIDMNAVGETLQKRICETNIVNGTQETPIMNKMLNKPKDMTRTNFYPNFKCDHCGSRYVVNPMRRGSKVSTARNRATPRHKIDPETQKVLTLCNACGLKFSRPRKIKQNKEVLSDEDQKRFIEEGERFAKDLSEKLNNEAAASLYCSSAKKTVCGCIQKYICGFEGSTVDEIIERAKNILDICLQAVELKKKKCYPAEILESKPGKKNGLKIGLGNGHRKSKEFEDFVLMKRTFLRTTLKFCEKGTQKILSYSNNFLHKKMKTDPDKGIRIERQKGKAALGMLVPIDNLTDQGCCVDNCVRMSLTHGRLLEVWRERATSSQVEARRVLAEMLTPSGGNRANCYRFVGLVTGCSHSTIGKVNDQMKSTGGDREPPEHGLKKYWKEKPKAKIDDMLAQTKFIPSYQILQTAANSAGLATMIECITESKPTEPVVKKMRRQPNKTTKGGAKKNKIILPSNTDGTLPVNIVADNGGHVTANIQNVQTVIAYPNGGYISIPTGLAAGNTIAIPSGVSLHTMQQQVAQQQHQQQLQLQIEMLQQQLQNSQSGNIAQHAPLTSIVDENPEYVVNVSNGIEQNNNVQSVGTPVVVENVTTQDLIPQPSYVQNVVTHSLVSNVANSHSVLPTIASYTSENVNFVSSGENVGILHPNSEAVQNHIANMSLLATSGTNREEINIIPQNNATVNVITPQNSLAETSVIGVCATAPIESLRQVHLITSQSPTMALSQPVTLSLQTPSNLPTMLLTQSTSNEQRQAALQAPSISYSNLPTMLLTQSNSNEQRQATIPTMLLAQSTSNEQQQYTQTPSISNLPTMLLTQSSSMEQQRQATLQTPSISNLPTMILTQSSSTEQRQTALQTPSISNLPTMLLTRSTANEKQQTALQTPHISLSNLPTMLLTQSSSNEQRQAALQAPSISNLPTMLINQSTSNEQRQATLPTVLLNQTASNEQRQATLPTVLLTQSSSNEQRQTSLQAPSIPLTNPLTTYHSNLPTMLLTPSSSHEQRQATLQTPSLSNLPTMLLTQSSSHEQRQATLPTVLLAQSTSNEQRQATLQAPSISLSNLPTMLLTQSNANEPTQPTHAQQFIIQQQTSSGSEQLVFQRPLFSQPNTEHIVVQQTIPTMQSSTEQTVAVTSSVLPPMSSFNADAFLTNSNGMMMKYTVLNTATQIPSNTVIGEQSRQLDQNNTTLQMPFLPS